MDMAMMKTININYARQFSCQNKSGEVMREYLETWGFKSFVLCLILMNFMFLWLLLQQLNLLIFLDSFGDLNTAHFSI